MNEIGFVEKREPDWRRTSLLCDKADVSPVNLSRSELLELVRLYKRVSKDLSLARTQSTNIELIDFLNVLCVRAYAILYRPKSQGLWRGIANAVALSAQTVRKRAWFVLTSAVLLVGFAIFAYACLKLVPETKEVFVPPQYEESFAKWKSGEMEPRGALQSIAATLTYSSNNPTVSIVESAMGAATFGVLTVYSLFVNGTVLGALVHEVEQTGRVGYLFVRILPHGVTELSGGIIAGAAGFVLGWSLINPGRRKRSVALKEAGLDAIVLIATGIAMMFIAAPIEGFFSFNPLVPDVLKVALAIVSAVAWGLFWAGYGRRERAGSGHRERPA